MTSIKTKDGEGAGGTKFWPILLMVVHGFWGTHVLLYFYNETRSSHQRCSTKKLFFSLFNKVAGQKRLQHRCFPVNIAKHLF